MTGMGDLWGIMDKLGYQRVSVSVCAPHTPSGIVATGKHSELWRVREYVTGIKPLSSSTDPTYTYRQ